MPRRVLHRVIAVAATSATAAGLLLIASPGAPLAAADPILTANYNASAGSSILSLNSLSVLGLPVATAAVGPTTAIAGSGQTSSASANNLSLGLFGSPAGITFLLRERWP